MIRMHYKDAEQLAVLCNGCGEAMRFMGEWPIQYPQDDKPKNITQAYRWSCKTCRIPNSIHKNGLPVMATIVGIEPARDV